MGSIFLLLALLIGLLIAGVALINNQVVTLNYYFGQISITLFMLILGSAVAGALVMIFFGFFAVSISTLIPGLSAVMKKRCSAVLIVWRRIRAT